MSDFLIDRLLHFLLKKEERKTNYFLKDEIKNLKLVNLGMTNREHYFIFQGGNFERILV